MDIEAKHAELCTVLDARIAELTGYIAELQATLQEVKRADQVVRVRAVEIINDAGEIVARLAADAAGNGCLLVSDRHGLAAIVGTSTPTGGRLAVLDASGHVAAGLHAFAGHGAVLLAGPDGKADQIVGGSLGA